MEIKYRCMDKIYVRKIKVYAYHGCLSEERVIGSPYSVDVSVWADLSQSSKTDELKDTVDYVAINAIVSREMAIPSNLLENVARRILDGVLAIGSVKKASVRVSKINPPIGGDVESVCVRLKGCNVD